MEPTPENLCRTSVDVTILVKAIRSLRILSYILQFPAYGCLGFGVAALELPYLESGSRVHAPGPILAVLILVLAIVAALLIPWLISHLAYRIATAGTVIASIMQLLALTGMASIIVNAESDGPTVYDYMTTAAVLIWDCYLLYTLAYAGRANAWCDSNLGMSASDFFRRGNEQCKAALRGIHHWAGLAVVSVALAAPLILSIVAGGVATDRLLICILINSALWYSIFHQLTRRRPANVEHARQKDQRPIWLYLRSFTDDAIELRGQFGRRYSFEESIINGLWEFGPVLAIGDDTGPQRGAVREPSTDDSWQTTARERISECRGIVMVAGTTAGLRWEVDEITQDDSIERLVIVLPPVSHEEKVARFDNLHPRIPQVMGTLGAANDRCALAALQVSTRRNQGICTITASNHSPLAFEIGLSVAAFLVDSPRSERTSEQVRLPKDVSSLDAAFSNADEWLASRSSR